MNCKHIDGEQARRERPETLPPEVIDAVAHYNLPAHQTTIINWVRAADLDAIDLGLSCC